MEFFKKDLDELGIAISEHQFQQFEKYYEFLVSWNEKVNLTAITKREEVFKKHFIDSVSLVKAIDLEQVQKVIDIGTGAGFPGLALKIAFPKLKMTLLDSLQKRITFLNTVIKELGLEDVDTIHGRAEDYAKPALLREKYDLCVSRAVANMSTLSEYCLPFVKVGGQFIPYKSEKISEEIEVAGHAISMLGGEIVNQVEFVLPNSDIYRNLVVINKIQSTPKKYPRKAGMAAKEPLK